MRTKPRSITFFLESVRGKKSLFSSKTKGLTDHKLPIFNTAIDLRNEIAERIHGIKCKIVHTTNNNSEGDVELVPFSIEAD